MISFEASKRVPFRFRIARAVNKRFVFVDSEDAAYSLAGRDLKLRIKPSAGASTNIFELTLSSGLVISGAGNNQLDITMTEVQTSIPQGVYYLEFSDATSKKTWPMRGPAEFAYEFADDLQGESELTFTLDTDVVYVQVQESGGSGGSGILGTFNVADLPAAADHSGEMAFVPDEIGGAVIAFSDGANWRRCTDREIVQVWILEQGSWNDGGQWGDDKTWKDS
jgi:hypothetical protein